MEAVLDKPKKAAGPAGPPASSGGLPPPVVDGLKDFPLYTVTAKGALYVPSSMNRTDFDLLRQQIEAYLKVIEATSVRPDPPAND